MNEGDFSSRMARQIRDLGVFAHKHADRFRSGLSDVYFCGGNWIECKYIPMPKRQVSILKWMTTDQIAFARRVISCDDRAFVAALWAPPHGKKWVTLLPFQFVYEYQYWSRESIEEYGRLYDGNLSWSDVIGPQWERNVRNDWYADYTRGLTGYATPPSIQEGGAELSAEIVRTNQG